MSWQTSEFVLAMRAEPCAYCGARPGERCRSKSGRSKREEHADRFYAVKAKWRVEE